MASELRIGGLLVRPATAEIVAAQGAVRVELKSMAVLVELARNPGEVLSRQEILDAVWGDAFVGEEALTHCIWDLRRAFGDDARRPRVVRTVARRGYQLIAEVEAVASATVTTVVSFAGGSDPGLPAETYGGRDVSEREYSFDRPVVAVRYALACQHAIRNSAEGPSEFRVGIHCGEATLRAPDESGRSHLEGPALDLSRKLAALARAGQILLTRSAFDLAREAGEVEEREDGEALRWLAHGAYALHELESPLRVYEVGTEGLAPLEAPDDSSAGARLVADDVIPGWRPARGLNVPARSRFRLERKIGEGGFGEAWLALDDESGEPRVFKFCHQRERLRALQREVTLLRLLKEALGDREDITRLLDWNFDQRPYFLETEYAAAGSLLEWADDEGGALEVPLETRLELVAQCADALAGAHSVGVLHRDVKPANILIQPDARGVPRARLTDFGIGMVTDRDLLDDVGITVQGLTASETETSGSSDTGTRLYQAPELIEGRRATVQADVYALGVTLYQLVVGDLGRALAPGWKRGVEDDLLAEDIAAAVDGDPARRLADASQLAARLRSLESRREAQRARAAERAEATEALAALESARRRRRVVAAALAGLALFGGAMAYQAHRISLAADLAQREAETSREVKEFLENLFLTSDPTRGKKDDLSARDLLDRGSERISSELEAQPAVKAALLSTMGTAYAGLGFLDEAESLLGSALELGEEHLEPSDSTLMDIQQKRAAVLRDRGDYRGAEELYRKVLAVRRETHGPAHPELARTLQFLGVARWRLGLYDDARASLEEALTMNREVLEPDDPDLATNLNSLGLVLWELRDLPAAEERFSESLEIRRQVLGDDHPQVGTTLNSLALVARADGRFEDAEQRYRQAIEVLRAAMGEEHPWIASTLANLGRTLAAAGRSEEAESVTRESLAMKRRLYGEGHPSIATSLSALGHLRISAGDFAEAEEVFRSALAMRQKFLGEEHPATSASRLDLGYLLVRRGEPGASEPLLRQALTGSEATLPAGNRNILAIKVTLGEALTALERGGEARALFDTVLAEIEHETDEDLADRAREGLAELSDGG